MGKSTIIVDTNPDDDNRLGLGPGQALTAEELSTYPPFQHVDKKRLANYCDGVWARQYMPGEYVCRQGDFGSTAFYIVSGSVRVILRSAEEAPKPKVRSGAGSWLGRIFGKGGRGRGGTSKQSSHQPASNGFIPVDATRDVDRVTRTVLLSKGDLLGEMACLRKLPRAADCIAEQTTVCLEMLPHVFQLIAENPKQRVWREKKAKFLRENPGRRFEEPRPPDTAIQALQRERAKQELRQCEILKPIPTEMLEKMTQRVDLVDYEPGEVICAQGEPSAEFYLIRRGFVKVSQRAIGEGEDLVINYMSRGGYFGEIGLLENTRRTVSCSAMGHVEIIAMTKADFDELIVTSPEFAAELRETQKQRRQMIHERLSIRAGFDFKEYTDQELMQGHNLLLFDLDRCTRCDECVRACADSHDGVTRLRREGHRFDKYFVPTSCRSCRDPVCLTMCPVGSIGRSNTGAIIIEDWCIGCRMCEENCPYGNIRMHQTEVESGERIFRKQIVSRKRRVKFPPPVPPDVDLAALPFGMEYDAENGWLSFADVAKAVSEDKLLAFSADKRYQAAVKELIAKGATVVSLPVLPTLADKPRDVRAMVKTETKPAPSLSFLGIVDSSNEKGYRSLSSDPAYQAGVDRAKKESRGMTAVMSKAVVCDLCESLDGTPRCVHACPHDAAFRIDAQEFFQKEGKTR